MTATITVTAAVALAIVVIATAVAPVARRPVPVAHPSQRHGSHRRLLSSWVEAATRSGAAHRRLPTPTAEDVATWCEALARQVRSGASLRHAVETVEPASAVLQRHLEPLRRRLTRGVTLRAATAGSAPAAEAASEATTTATATEGMAAGADLRLALDMIGVAATLGGSPAAALDRTATTLRRRATDRAERRSQAAQARISAHVLTVVPVALLALLVLSDPAIRAAVTTPIGTACVGGGLVLNGLGWLWMRAVIGAPR